MKTELKCVQYNEVCKTKLDQFVKDYNYTLIIKKKSITWAQDTRVFTMITVFYSPNIVRTLC